MITDHEINLLAAYMVDTHGRKALSYADTAVCELEQIGEKMRAETQGACAPPRRDRIACVRVSCAVRSRRSYGVHASCTGTDCTR